MIYGTVEDGRFVAILSSNKKPSPEAIPLPDDFRGMVAQHVEEFNPDWSLKPYSRRVAEGYAPLPPGYKLLGEEIVPMSEAERVEAGIASLPQGMKIEGDKIVPMTLREKYEAGVEELPTGFKLGPDEERPLIPMDDEELYSRGLITDKERRIRKLRSDLYALQELFEEIDASSVRPLRAKLAGLAAPEDEEKLRALEESAVRARTQQSEIRSALSALEAPE